MPTLFFSDSRALEQVLAKGVVPPSISQFPVLAHLNSQGEYRLNPLVPISDEVIFGIVENGGKLLSSTTPNSGKTVECWHRLIPLDAFDPPLNWTGSRFLFDIPAGELPQLASEVHRLSGQALELAWSTDLEHDDDDPRVWVRVHGAPFFTLSRFLEQNLAPTLSVFVENAPRVWTPAGYRHPLANQILVPQGKVLFLRPPRSWTKVADRQWIGEVAEFPLSRAIDPPADPTKPIEGGNCDLDKLPTTVKLVKSADRDAPQLWVITTDALAALSELVRTADERTLAQLNFAAFPSDTGPVVVLRARRAKVALPVLVSGMSAYKAAHNLPNLYVPSDHRLQPGARRDALRQMFAPDARRLTWLRILPDGAFRPESLPLSAFHPLTDWVQYRVETAAVVRQAWQQSADWSFERYSVRRSPTPRPVAIQVPEVETVPFPATLPIPEPSAPKSTLLGKMLSWFKSRKPEPESLQSEEPATIPVETAVPIALDLPREKPVAASARATEVRRRSEQLEARFLKDLPQLTVEQQLAGWPELAGVYGQLNNHADAAICWVNALWEQRRLSSLWAWGWFRAEATQARWKPSDADLARFLSLPATPEKTRAIAAYVVCATLQEPVPQALRENLGSIQVQLDTHENHLSIRAAWLAKIALSRIVKGDVLSLARTRDRLLERLRATGLADDLDLPAFLQFNEPGAGIHLQEVRKWLRNRHEPLQRWIASLGNSGESQDASSPSLAALQSVGLKPEIPNTCAYADLLLAWGLARLRYIEDAAPLLARARQRLSGSDPVHSLLVDGFEFRIQLARERKSQNEPFPAEWLARLKNLPSLARYRVDKLREHSGIFDSSDRLPAYWASAFRDFAGWDSLRKQLHELPSLDSSGLNSRLESILSAASADPLSHAMALSQAIDYLQKLSPGLSDRVLQQLSPALDRVAGNLRVQVPLLERAFHAAEIFNNVPLAQTLLGQFTRLLDEVRAPAELSGIDSLTGTLVDCLRALGLHSELERIIGQLLRGILRGQEMAQARAANSSQWPAILRTLTHIAAGWIACGKEDEAHALLEQVCKDLYGISLSSRDRTALALTYAHRLGELASRVALGPMALGRFEALFQGLQGISLSGTTNSHYTLKPLELIDTMVRGIVHHDFALAPAVRNWLMDDEHRVRQRIQRDFEETLKQQRE
jgi:hypothetical protein